MVKMGDKIYWNFQNNCNARTYTSKRFDVICWSGGLTMTFLFHVCHI